MIRKYNVYESANFSTYYNIDFKMVIESELYKIQFYAIFQVINKENSLIKKINGLLNIRGQSIPN